MLITSWRKPGRNKTDFLTGFMVNLCPVRSFDPRRKKDVNEGEENLKSSNLGTDYL